MTDPKLHLPVVIIWTKDKAKCLQQLKSKFKRFVSSKEPILEHNDKKHISSRVNIIVGTSMEKIIGHNKNKIRWYK